MARATSGIVIPNRLPWHLRLVVWCLSWLARLIMLSWRLRVEEPPPQPEKGPVIFCVWHNRLSLAVMIWTKHARFKWPAEGIAALVSASKDGAILAEVLANFGIETIRGSSSRRGPQALLEATSWLEKNYNVAITPDGPRGPCYQVHLGIVQLAQLSGCPIIPVCSRIHRKYTFKSWDRFQIPLPFSRCDLKYGEPFYVPREASDEEREALRLRLKKNMMALTED
jgi:lysophospholipid acyltransferase (LPLAT)-like uncharacterized protein